MDFIALNNTKVHFRSYNFEDGCHLPQDHIHLWKADYKALENKIEFFSKLLNDQEIQRASRYKKKLIGRQFIIFRGVLRVLLGRYLSSDPAGITLSYSSTGKPYLKDSNLNFNLSHSSDKAVFAFRKAVHIGVDIEKINNNKEHLKLAKRFFSDREYKMFERIKKKDISSAFARCWVRKEAFVKAIGKGLSYGLGSFSVSADDKNESISSEEPGACPDLIACKLPVFYPFEDTICSIAVIGTPEIDCFEFSLSCL